MQGSNITIHCKANHQYATWKLRGQHLPVVNEVVGGESLIAFKVVNAKEGDTGLYYCEGIGVDRMGGIYQFNNSVDVRVASNLN